MKSFLPSMGIAPPNRLHLRASSRRLPDGGSCLFEIRSVVEGRPDASTAVLDGLRIDPGVHPAGEHPSTTMLSTAPKRVTRARLWRDLFERNGLGENISPVRNSATGQPSRFQSVPVPVSFLEES